MEIELRTLWAAIIFYVIGGSLAIGAVVLKKRPERAVLTLLLIGWLLQTAAVLLR